MMQVYRPAARVAPSQVVALKAMMMVQMPYGDPGFAGAVLKSVCCHVPRRPGLSLVR
jgi:hypothetical protein